jgi:tagatose 6-phosphate kinase
VIVVGGFNSAIDKAAELDALVPGEVLRLRNVRPLAGGKGLHVALTCAILGEPVTLVGLTDPATGPLFDETLGVHGGRFVGVESDGPIRTCLALRDREGRTTELLEPGPALSEDTATRLVETFVAEASRADYAVLSGSLPAGLGAETYARLIRRLGRSRVALDTSGEPLRQGLAAQPLLAKPNRQEATHLLGHTIDTMADAAAAAERLSSLGPQIVLLSLGSTGAIVRTPERLFVVRPPAVEAQNAVGAGDCLLGGFMVGLQRGWPLERCGRFAVACGTAKVMHPDTGVLRPSDVETIAAAVSIEEAR